MRVKMVMRCNMGIILRILFMIHFFFSIFAVIDNLFGTGYWMSQLLVAILYFTVFFGNKEFKMIPLLFTATVLTLITDSVFIGVFWDQYRKIREDSPNSTKPRLDFNAACAIILLAFKIPMAIIHAIIIFKMKIPLFVDETLSEFDNVATSSVAAPSTTQPLVNAGPVNVTKSAENPTPANPPKPVENTTSVNPPKAVENPSPASTPKSTKSIAPTDPPKPAESPTTTPVDPPQAETEETTPVSISEAIEKAVSD